MNSNNLNKILLIIIGALIGIILSVSVIGIASKKAVPGKNLRDADPEPTAKGIESLNKHSDEKIAAYTGLGTIRCITAPNPDKENDTGTLVVITPWLSYPEGDSVFFEELSRKRLVISGIITAYIGDHTQKELLSQTEDKIKADLLQTINGQLTLGKISQVYFTDYIFLE